MSPMSSRPGISALIALAGPAAAGAVIGVPLGSRQILVQAATVPAAIVGVTAFMVPALYIASTLAGISPPAQEVGRAVLGGLRSTGLLLLGLSPALLFLLTTTPNELLSLLLIALALLGAAAVGMRALYGLLFGPSVPRLRSLPVYGGWVLVCLGLAAHLLLEHTARPYLWQAFKGHDCVTTVPGDAAPIAPARRAS